MGNNHYDIAQEKARPLMNAIQRMRREYPRTPEECFSSGDINEFIKIHDQTANFIYDRSGIPQSRVGEQVKQYQDGQWLTEVESRMKLQDLLNAQQEAGMYMPHDRDQYDQYGLPIISPNKWRKNDKDSRPPKDGTLIECSDDWFEIPVGPFGVSIHLKAESQIRVIHYIDRAENPGADSNHMYHEGWADFLTGYSCDPPGIWRYHELLVPSKSIHHFKLY